MAIPTEKSPEIEHLINSVIPCGRKRAESIKANICVWCGQPAIVFIDEFSKNEYTISGLCQKCQDETFELVEES